MSPLFPHTAGTADVTSAPYTEQSLSIGVVVAIVIVATLVLAIILDTICFFCKDAGLTATLVHKVGGKDTREREAIMETESERINQR